MTSQGPTIKRQDYPTPFVLGHKGYCRTTVTKEYPPCGNRFEIPVEDLVRAHQALLLPFDEASFKKRLFNAEKIPHTDRIFSILAEVIMRRSRDTHAQIGLSRFHLVDYLRTRNKKDRDYHYRMEDGILSGPVRLDPKTKEPCTMALVFSVMPVNQHAPSDRALMEAREMADAVEVFWRAPLAKASARFKTGPAPI